MRKPGYSLPLMEAYYGTQREMASVRRSIAYHREGLEKTERRLAELEAQWTWLHDHRADDIAVMLAQHAKVRASLAGPDRAVLEGRTE